MCAEPTAGEPRGRTRLARGVPRRRRGSLTLSASSRQLSEACETPAVRRVSSKTRNAAEGVKACVTPKLVRSARLCRNVTQNPTIGRVTTDV